MIAREQNRLTLVSLQSVRNNIQGHDFSDDLQAYTASIEKYM